MASAPGPAGAPAPAQPNATVPPSECSTTPTYDHAVPPFDLVAAGSVDRDGDVVVGALANNDLSFRAFSANYSASTVTVSALTCLPGPVLDRPAIVGDRLHSQIFAEGTDFTLRYAERRIGRSWSGWRAVRV